MDINVILLHFLSLLCIRLEFKNHVFNNEHDLVVSE